MKAARKRSFGAWFLAALSSGLLASSCLVGPDEVQGPCSTDIDCPEDGNPCTKSVCGANGFCSAVAQDLPLGDPRCDDQNPCTKEACSEGKCVYSAQALPFGETGCDDQNPCTDDVCGDGACAHIPASAPPNDGNDCTIDSCDGGVASHKALPDNTPCGQAGQLVCTSGLCKCVTAEECGTSTECLKFACTNNMCSSASLPEGTLVNTGNPGDCLKRVCDAANNVVTVPDLTDAPEGIPGDCNKKACDVDGTVIDVPDDLDVPPTDNNDCTTEACNSGVPVNHVMVADGTPCGNIQAQCALAPGGGYQYTAGTTCAGGDCTASSPVSCGLFKCSGTKCKTSCSADADCITGTFCDLGTNTCKPQGNTGTPCGNDGQCSSNHCVDGVCCASVCDGFCQRCNDAASPGLCVATQAGQDPDNECAGATACNGQGGCASPLGGGCAADAECLSGICTDSTCCDAVCSGACKRCDIAGSVGSCTLVGANVTAAGCSGTLACDGLGNCKTANGQACAANTDCLSGFCQEGFCCNSACAGACARCDIAGSVGTCTNVPAGQQVAGCNATNVCDGNNLCKKSNGQTCVGPNDCVSGFCPSEHGLGNRYCCNAACTETCKSCAGSKTVGQVNGTCDNIKDKTDPDDECVGGCNVNDGTGCCVLSGGASMCH